MGEMALTVEERGPGRYFWVVLEAANDESLDVIVYRRARVAEDAQASYSSALALGAAMLRRISGD